MGKQADNKNPDEVNSRILLLILDELRAIRRRMDDALSPDHSGIAPPPMSPLRLPTPQADYAEFEEVDILESEVLDDLQAEPPAEPTTHAREEPKSQQLEETELLELQIPTSPEGQDALFSEQKQIIENLMSLARFAQAEQRAEALLAALPNNSETEALLDTVRRESSAFSAEQQSRLFGEFHRCTEARQWIKAQSVAEQLLEKYPDCEEARTVSSSMSTVRKNAHFEEARSLRDRIGDLIKRKRYSEAVKIAEDLIDRFPETRVAIQLRSLLPDLKKRGGSSR